MKYILNSLLIYLFFLSAPIFSQTSIKNQIQEYLDRYRELNRFSGSVSVLQNEQIVFEGSVGMSDYTHGKKNTSNTQFCIAGLSEQFTAYLIMKLVNEGKLNLKENIVTYLPDLAWEGTCEITVEQLLSHTSSLQDYPQIWEISQNPEKQFYTIQDLTNYLKSVEIKNEDQNKFNYSKLNYNILGLILENITETSLSELLKNEVFVPLKMSDSFLLNSIEKPNYFTKGHISLVHEIKEAPILHPINLFAAQGIISTTGDLTKWAIFVKNKLIGSTEYQLMFSPKNNNYGFGYHIKNDKRTQKINLISTGNGIYTSGFNAFMEVDLVKNQTIVILGNQRHPVSGEIGVGIKAIINNEPYKMPLARKTIKVSNTVLKSYVGNYSLTKDIIIKVTLNNDHLIVDDGFRPSSQIFPQSKNQFYLKDNDAAIEFVKTENKVKGMILKDGFVNGKFIKKIR